ncbi:MAG: hypothetical protein ABIL25_05965 [candidate division WOR-3 bacterium]
MKHKQDSTADASGNRPAQEKAVRATHRYRAKTDPSRVYLLLEEKNPQMVGRYEAQARILASIDEIVRGLVILANVPPLTRFWYATYGRQVYALWRRNRGRLSSSEIALLEQRWTSRGLDPEVLIRVRLKVLESLDSPTSVRSGNQARTDNEAPHIA